MNLAGAKAQLDLLYAELPTVECRRKCQSACGPITMSFVEWERIKKKLGYEPRTASISEPCPMLRSGLCSVYAMRPIICRIWGLAETMLCPWGCQPKPRPLTTREAYLFLARADVIGARTDEERAAGEQAVQVLSEASDDDPRFLLAAALHVRPRIET